MVLDNLNICVHFLKVIFMLIGTIVFPFLLSGVSLAIRSPDIIFGQQVFKNWMTRAGYTILAFIMTPIQFAIMHTKYYFLSLELKVLHSTRNLQMNYYAWFSPARQHCQSSPFTTKWAKLAELALLRNGPQDFDFFDCHESQTFILAEIHFT